MIEDRRKEKENRGEELRRKIEERGWEGKRRRSGWDKFSELLTYKGIYSGTALT